MDQQEKIKMSKKEPTLKEPLFAIKYNRFHVVDTNGEWVATLFLVTSGNKIERTLDTLQKDGYRTDWAEWGVDGSFIKFIEEFEA